MAASAGAAKKSADGPKFVPKFVWTDEDSEKFAALKSQVLNAPLLEYLDYSRPIFVRCDASRFGCGAVLFQYDDAGREHVACYASRKFIDVETR